MAADAVLNSTVAMTITQLTPHDTNTFTPPTFGIRLIVSAAGDIKFGFSGGATMTKNYPVVGSYLDSDGANQIFVTGSTATFTAYARN